MDIRNTRQLKDFPPGGSPTPGKDRKLFVFFPDYHCRVGGGDCCQLHSESADRQDRRPWKHGRPFRPDHCPNAAAHRAGGFSHVLGAGLSVHDAPHCPGTVRFPQRDATGFDRCWVLLRCTLLKG